MTIAVDWYVRPQTNKQTSKQVNCVLKGQNLGATTLTMFYPDLCYNEVCNLTVIS